MAETSTETVGNGDGGDKHGNAVLMVVVETSTETVLMVMPETSTKTVLMAVADTSTETA